MGELIVVRIKVRVSVEEWWVMDDGWFLEERKELVGVSLSGCVGNMGWNDLVDFVFDGVEMMEWDGRVNMEFGEIWV